MQATQYIWKNGELINWNDATTHVLTHALHYASGVFEGIRAYKTEKGSAVFRLNEHIDRLIFSANALKLHLPYSREELINASIKTISENGLDEGYIRPLVYNGYGALGVGTQNPTEVIIACWDWPKYHATDGGLDVKTSSYIRIHPKSTVVGAKICGHYINGLLALQEIQGTKYHEALMLDAEGFVSECSSANIFIVKDGVIYTPGLGTILPGITRDFVIKLANDLGYKVVETRFTRDEIYNSDETFFTGTAVEVTVMRSLDDKIIGQDGVNPVANKIKEAFKKVVTGQDDRYSDYLTYYTK